jgi:hypothetical protein
MNKCRNYLAAVALSGAASLLNGCATRPAAVQQKEIDATHLLSQLNADDSRPTPGVFYARNERSRAEVLDILSAKPVYEGGSWIERGDTEPTAFTVAQRNIGQPLVACAELSWWQRSVKRMPCDVPSPVTVELHFATAQREVLLNPGSVVEILNRPLTGYSYNREAENRILAWRSSIATALHRQRGDGDGDVSLCLGRQLGIEGIVRVVGRIDAEGAEAFAREVMHGARLIIEPVPSNTAASPYEFRLTTPVILQASFRRIVLVDGVGESRIDFALGDSTQQTLRGLPSVSPRTEEASRLTSDQR